jgi:hypothetical protein
MSDNILKQIAAIIAPHLRYKHKDSRSLEIAEKILKEINNKN